MDNYIVIKIGTRRTKPRFFDNLTEALEDAEIKSRKNKAEYSVIKSYKKDNFTGSTYYMEYANFINGKRTK